MTSFIISIFLLGFASVINQICKKYNLQYTIVLLIFGILFWFLDNYIWLWIFSNFELTSDLLFLVFLPILIFESWYNIKRSQMSKENLNIRTLAIFGLLISVFFIWFVWKYILSLFGIIVPIEVMFLFGAIISATDPVAVLSIFKQLGISKRLQLIFEWESLFNDWTAVALFFIILEIIKKWSFDSSDIWMWFVIFVSMVFFWIILWWFFGIVFAKIIKQIKNNEFSEISLTMILAHITFVISMFINQRTHHNFGFELVSWVIATTYSAIIMWNYGKTKISPKVEVYMEKFWWFFGFLINSMIFLMMWIMINHLIKLSDEFFILSFCIILIVSLARMFSVYLPINILNIFRKKEKVIWRNRQHLLAFWDLRWVLAIMLAMMIPSDLHITEFANLNIREFVITVCIIYVVFSLIIKWSMMNRVIKKLKIQTSLDLEKFDKFESEIIIYNKILEKINRMKSDSHTDEKIYELLLENYLSKLNTSILNLQIFIQKNENSEKIIKQALALQALGVEKQYLEEMFKYNEIDEYLYIYLKSKIEKQIHRLEKWEDQIQPWKTTKRFWLLQIVSKITHRYDYYNKDCMKRYKINRAKFIITSKVIRHMKNISHINFGFEKKYFDEIVELYKYFHQRAKKNIKELYIENKQNIENINSILITKMLYKAEEIEIKDMLSKEIINENIYKKYMENIEKEIDK